MAEERAGSVEVRVIPEALVAEWQREIEKTAEALRTSVKSDLKLNKGAVGALVKETKAALAKRKDLPKLNVQLQVAKSEVRRAVKEINAHTKTLEKKPSINVGLSITQREVRRAITEANAAIAASNRKPPKLKVLVDLDENQQQLVRETRTTIREVDAIVKATGAVEIPLDLDEKSIARVAEKAAAAMAVVQARIDAQWLAREKTAELAAIASAQRVSEAHQKEINKQLAREAGLDARVLEDERKHQNRLLNEKRLGLDKATLEEIKHANKVALLRERAELQQRASSLTTLRRLRNDLSQFDASTTRLLRRTSLYFGVFTAGVAASFAAIAGFALKSFADTEQQLQRTAAVLGTDVFSRIMADTNDMERAFAGFREEVQKTSGALQQTVNLTALGTVFDQTEIATGTRALAQAGLQIDEIKASMLGVAQFAQNEELLPEEAVQDLVQGATAAGESLKDLSLLADRFTFVANNTTASATEVAQAFANRAAPAFRAYGEEVNSTLAVLNLFAAAGIKGKTAGEQAGILIREVNKASTKTPETAAAWEKYGIAVGNVNGVQVPFLQTLGELGTLLDNVRTKKGSQELARLRKELGLTEKSGAGLLQLLPQITEGTGGSAEKAVQRLQNLEKQIGRSVGATSRQATVIMDTLSFQTDLLSNQITSMFKAAAAPGGRALTQVFKELNGEVKLVNGELVQTGGFADALQEKFIKVGKRISEAIVPAIRRFALEGEGEEFFGGLFEMYRGFLGGLRDAFGEFRREVFGEGSNRGFFSVMGAGFAALGDFASETLPRIGRALGIIVGFVRENTEAVRLFLKGWLGLFLVSKLLRLFIIPLVGVATQLKAIAGGINAVATAGLSQWLVSSIRGMLGLTAATTAQTGATNALAAAQARLAAAEAAQAAVPAGGFRGFSRRADVVTAGAEVSRLAPANAAAAASAGRLSKALTGLRASMGLLLKVSLIIPVALGAIKGAADQLNASFGGDGNVTLRDFRNGMKDVGSAIASVVRPIISVVTWTGKLLIGFGQILGASGVLAVTYVFKALAWAIKSVVDLAGAVLGFFGDLLMKIPGVETAVRKVGDAFGWVGEQFGKLGGEGGGISKVGDSLGWLADRQRELYGETNALSPVFDRAAKAMGDQESRADALTAKLQKQNAERRKAHNEELARIEKEQQKYRVLGVTHGFLINNFRQTIAGNKALSASLGLSGAKLTDAQKRAGNFALVLDVLNGEVKNAALRQQILAAASGDVNTNMLKLSGGANVIKRLTDAVAEGSEKAAQRLIEMRNAAIIAARDKNIAELISGETRIGGTFRNREIQRIRRDAAAQIKSYRQIINEELKRGNKNEVAFTPDFADIPDIAGAAEEATTAIRETQTAAERAAAAVDKMGAAQFKAAADATIKKVLKLPEGYKATTREVALLQRAMPALDAALEQQTAMVTKLDEALQALQSTQLEGTKLFSDQNFAIDQQVKQLQLQRVDLIIAGTIEDDPAIKAIDDQIRALQLQTERLSLQESLQLDPLKRKLEETFNPVKELSFEAIIAEFEKLNKQKVVLDARVSRTETIKARLEQVAGDAAEKFKGVGLNVTQGITAGVEAGKPQIIKGARDMSNTLVATTRRQLGIASPSRVMFEQGAFVVDGFVGGVNAGHGEIVNAGVTTMFSFLTGMRNVYENRVQPFVLGIAEWIKNNKGPIAYDAQLLRPAGEAMMSGFHRGLADGFSEVKGWVKRVGPQLANDTFPKELFVERSARFLINNAKVDSTFTPEDAFGDLIYDVLGGLGKFDPTLSFLHKTLSLADTIDMARRLIAGTSMNTGGMGQLFRPWDLDSAHSQGTAADLGTGSGRPSADSLRLFEKIKPLLGTVFRQIIHNGLGMTAGGGSFFDANHFDHIHVEFLKGLGFSLLSGKKGQGGIAIPGMPPIVGQALAQASQATGLPAALLAAISKQESGWRTDAGSPAGARGLMQLMPGTAASLGVTNILDPFQNALGGAKYIKQQIDAFGSLKLALAAYNAGPGNVQRYGGIPPFPETQHYVRAVLEYLRKFGGIGNFRAQGGNVNANMPTWVGEGGRELWVPDRSGTIISNANIEALIRLAQQGKVGKGGGDYIDNRVTHVSSNAVDPAAVAALVDAKMRAQVTGVRR